jgi:hypothetical protein
LPSAEPAFTDLYQRLRRVAQRERARVDSAARLMQNSAALRAG